MRGIVSTSMDCRATAAGCPGDNVIGIVLIVLLAVAFFVGILSWVWARWDRGPFPIVMRIVGRTPMPRKRKK